MNKTYSGFLRVPESGISDSSSVPSDPVRYTSYLRILSKAKSPDAPSPRRERFLGQKKLVGGDLAFGVKPRWAR